MTLRPCSSLVRADPMFPISLDAAPYSLPHHHEKENEYAALLHRTLCLGVGLYLRPKQHLLLLCSVKIENNIRRVAQVVAKLGPKYRKRVLVLVHDGMYKNSATSLRADTPEDIADACTMTQLEYHNAELERVRRCYVFTRAAKKTAVFVEQLDALILAYRTGAFAALGLGMHMAADLRAAFRILTDAAVPIHFIVVSMYTEDLDTVVEWASGRGIHILTYDFALPIGGEVTRVSSTRNELTHMKEWMAAVTAQPPQYAALRKCTIPSSE